MKINKLFIVFYFVCRYQGINLNMSKEEFNEYIKDGSLKGYFYFEEIWDKLDEL